MRLHVFAKCAQSPTSTCILAIGFSQIAWQRRAHCLLGKCDLRYPSVLETGIECCRNILSLAAKEVVAGRECRERGAWSLTRPEWM